MSGVYFSIPVLVGYYVSTAAVEISESTVEKRFGHSKVHPTSRSANSSISNEDHDDKILGIGVHLVTSDEETQEVNRVNLERFLKRQRKLKEKRELEALGNSNI
jgi:alanine racemase